MTHRIHLAPRAWRDLETIEDYTLETWGVAQAEEYIRTMHIAFQLLAENPYLGYAKGHYRAYAAAQHIVIYRIAKARIEIMHILHPAMDVKARLKKPKP